MMYGRDLSLHQKIAGPNSTIEKALLFGCYYPKRILSNSHALSVVKSTMHPVIWESFMLQSVNECMKAEATSKPDVI